MPAEELSQRSQHLLRLLVDRHIREGQAVGSKTLLEASGLSISPATVRNILADLEGRGYIAKAHASSGRVPTVQGYRFFVDALLHVAPLDAGTIESLEAELDSDKSSRELIASASQLLSNLTGQAGLVSVPQHNTLRLRQIEFLPLSGCRVLVIIVADERDVQNRVIHTAREFSEIELKQAANEINARFAGLGLDTIRRAVLKAMEEDRNDIDRYMGNTLELARQALEENEPAQQDYLLVGENHLLNRASPERFDRLRQLFDAFEQKKDILDLIDRCLKADGVQLFIGEEAGYEVLGDFSVVTSPYRAGGSSLGALGVIGPTRMAYEQVIPMVDVTARLLGLALRSA